MDMELLKEIASKCNGSVIDGCLKEIARLRQQIATHTASQTDRDKAVAEACAKVCDAAEEGYAERESRLWPEMRTDAQQGVMEVSVDIRSGEWRKYLGETK